MHLNLSRLNHRGAWTAGLIVVLLLGVFVTMCGVAGCAKKVDANVEYYCPMHPTYVSDKPGDCPICGMKLVPRPKSARSELNGTGAGQPASGPPVAANEPAASAGVSGGPGSRRVLFYRNPMDPTVTSPVPMKDPMGMDYVPVYADEAAGAVPPGATGSNVAGYSTVTLNDEGIQLAGIQTTIAEEGEISQTIRTVGEVKADETRIRQVSLKNGGWVEKLYVNFNGQLVRRGAPLLSIYSPELLASQNEFLQAREAARRFANSDLEEVRRGGADLLDAARRRLALFDVPESFVAQLEKTGQPQRTVTLTSPASGYVTAKDVYEGSRVEPGMLLFTISDLSHVWIEGDVYESEVSRVAPGQTATLSLTYDPAVKLTARLSYVYPTLNPDTRTIRVRFDVDNPDMALKPGMFANVELATRPTRGVRIPESAVLETGTRRIVYVETSPGRFEPREVTVGMKADGLAEILSGVAPGERVVTGANFLLDSESRLRSDVAATSGAAPGTGTPGAGSATGTNPDSAAGAPR